MSVETADLNDWLLRLERQPVATPARSNMAAARAAVKEAGIVLLRSCPSSRERSLALTALQESLMWSNAAIARPVQHELFGGN